MKRGYTKLLYNQRNKDETIMSVIKRLFGEYVTSRLIRTQNRELSFRCIAYNMHRLTNLVIIVMISTEPNNKPVISEDLSESMIGLYRGAGIFANEEPVRLMTRRLIDLSQT